VCRVIDRRSEHGAVRPRRSRAARLATVALVLPLALLVSSPAYASTHPDDGSDPGSGLTGLQIVLIYVALPLGLMVLISLLAVLPSMARGPRYRPGLGWWAAPVWFNGPEDPDSALRAVEALPADQVGAFSGGGASARW
jgi:hypothetical protein